MKITKDGNGKYEVDLASTKITVCDKEVAGVNFVQHLFNPDVVSVVKKGEWDFIDDEEKKNG